jgi:hypothetical protein
MFCVFSVCTFSGIMISGITSGFNCITGFDDFRVLGKAGAERYLFF